jgi:hypothetical protein
VTLALVLSAAVAGPVAMAAGPAFVAPPATYVPPVTTTVTPYAAGRTLSWSAFNQLGGNGAPDPIFATQLVGVAGGNSRIVETGRDDLAGTAASWVSRDGGVSWTEYLVPGRPRGFGKLAAHAGVFVTTDGGFWSSRDGASWTPAATGPHAMQHVTLAAGPQGFVAFVQNGTSTITRVWTSPTGASDSWVAAPVQGIVSSFCPSSVAATSSRIVAIGTDCRVTSRARVLVSATGRTWTTGSVPSGLRVKGEFTRPPSISYVSGRFLVTGANPRETATWVWSSTDARTWRQVSSMPRVGTWTVDTIVSIVRLGPGWLAIGHRDMPADDAMLVAWRSADLRRWSRFSPPVAPCGATVHMVSQAAVTGGKLVAVGTPWSIGSQCGQTWMAALTP